MKTLTRKNSIILVSLGIVTAIALILTGNYYVNYKKPNVSKETLLLIYKDYSYMEFMDTLKAKGALKNWNSFKRASSNKELEKVFEPGRYLIKEGMNNQYIIRMIANGWQTPVNMVFRGYVRTLDKLAFVFSKWFEADSTSFANVIQDNNLIDSLGFNKQTFIGMFIPNTYEIYWTIEPKSLILRFKKEYDKFWTEERLAKAKAMKFSPMEVITLASIVAEETNTPSEWNKIAGVYINRIEKGIPLQACPTVKYAVIDTEPDIRRILLRHLNVDSPYNTYKRRGLPPGPITTPPTAIIDAVLNYEKSNYLYFCAKAEFDGTHHFSTTYSQHLKHSKEYNKAFNERKK